jgi:hypothetical protein
MRGNEPAELKTRRRDKRKNYRQGTVHIVPGSATTLCDEVTRPIRSGFGVFLRLTHRQEPRASRPVGTAWHPG